VGSLRSLKYNSHRHIEILGTTITTNDRLKFNYFQDWADGVAYCWYQGIQMNFCISYSSGRPWAELIFKLPSFTPGSDPIFGRNWTKFIYQLPSSSDSLKTFQHKMAQQYEGISVDGIFTIKRIHPTFLTDWICKSLYP
jgi:hypothetical protein